MKAGTSYGAYSAVVPRAARWQKKHYQEITSQTLNYKKNYINKMAAYQGFKKR